MKLRRGVAFAILAAVVVASVALVDSVVGATALGPVQRDPDAPNAPERLDCGGEKFAFVTALGELPGGMPRILADGGKLAAHGADFRATDVIGPGDDALPTRRFAAAALGTNHIFAAVEQGGIGYGVEYWSFTRQSAGWIGNRRWFGAAPASLPELLSVTCKEYAHLAAEAEARTPIQFHCVYASGGLTVFQYDGGGRHGNYEVGRPNGNGFLYPHQDVTYYGSNHAPTADDRTALVEMLTQARAAADGDEQCVPAAARFLKALGEPR